MLKPIIQYRKYYKRMFIVSSKMWQIQVNPTLWDTDGIRSNLLAGSLIIPFSKGNRQMKKVPEAGDSVCVVWKNLVHFRGRIIQGFQEGICHQADCFNKGNRNERIHAELKQFALVELNEIDERTQMPSMRNTWTWRN